MLSYFAGINHIAVIHPYRCTASTQRAALFEITVDSGVITYRKNAVTHSGIYGPRSVLRKFCPLPSALKKPFF